VRAKGHSSKTAKITIITSTMKFISVNHYIGVALWHRGATVRCSTCDQEVAGSIPGSGRNCVTTMGKSLTPACLDADSIRYYMESLNGYLYLYLYLNVKPSAYEKKVVSCKKQK